MATLVLGAVGSAIGGAFGGAILGFSGAAIGGFIGARLASAGQAQVSALARGATDLGQGFVLMSSRCSFELVQKCAIAGVGALATVSAPTALALSLARQADLKLAALASRGVMIFDKD